MTDQQQSGDAGQQQGGDSGQQTGDTGQQQNQGGNNNSGFTPPATQADLDRIINQATAKVHSRYSDYSDMKKKAEAHDKALEAAKSDQDKAVDAARKEGEKTATERSNARLVNAEVRAVAANLKFRDPHDAIAQLREQLGNVKVSDDGDVDADAVKKLLDELAKDKPYLVDDGKSQPTPAATAGIGVAGGTSLPSDPRARRMAILEQDIAAGKRNTD